MFCVSFFLKDNPQQFYSVAQRPSLWAEWALHSHRMASSVGMAMEGCLEAGALPPPPLTRESRAKLSHPPALLARLPASMPLWLSRRRWAREAAGTAAGSPSRTSHRCSDHRGAQCFPLLLSKLQQPPRVFSSGVGGPPAQASGSLSLCSPGLDPGSAGQHSPTGGQRRGGKQQWYRGHLGEGGAGGREKDKEKWWGQLLGGGIDERGVGLLLGGLASPWFDVVPDPGDVYACRT